MQDAVTEQAAPFVLGYRPWLDGVRAIAIITVMGGHLSAHLGLIGPQGLTGLEIFFVLSGFLITVLLLEETKRRGSIHLGGFYVRRARRLLPALGLLLVAIAGLSALGVPELQPHETLIRIGVVIGYSGNWVRSFTTNDLGLLAHTWSLSVEEQFYLLWPLALTLLLRRRITGARLAVLLLAGAGASMLWREVVLRIGDSAAANRHAYNGLDTRGYALLLGCAVGVIVHYDVLPKAADRVLTIAAAAAGLFIATFFLHTTLYPNGYAVYLNLMALATAVLILHLCRRPAGWPHRLLGVRPLVAIGRVSYGLYLYHFPIIKLMTPDRVHVSGTWLGILDIAVTAVVATASWHLVERRFIRRRSMAPAP